MTQPKKKRLQTEKTLGHRVRIARKQQKFTVAELARKINMRENYIIDIESDTITCVPADVLHRIAIALGTTIADLAGLPIRVRNK